VKTSLVERILQLFLAIIIVIYPFMFIWQGLDVTDTGFAMTNYALIFTHPESISYWGFNYWLTDIIGGLWLHGFSQFGLLGIRFAAALLMLICNILAYLIVRPYSSSRTLLLSMFLSITFIERMYWLNYDNLTALFYLATALCLTLGLRKSNTTLVFLAGLVLGANFFVRLTNPVGILLIVVIFVSGLLRRTPWVRQAVQTIAFLAGCSVSTAVLFIGMKWLGQLGLFQQTLQTLFSIAGGHTNTHSSSSLIVNFQTDEWMALQSFGYILLGTFTLALILLITRRLKLISVQVMLMSGLIIYLTVRYYPVLTDRYHAMAVTVGLLTGILLWSAWTHRRTNPDWSVICVLAFVILFVFPLGSDLGIRIAGYGMYLAIPVAAQSLHEMFTHAPRELSEKIQQPRFALAFTTTEWRYLYSVVTGALIILAAITGYHYTYRDTSVRMAMTSTVNHPDLRDIYTTPTRAQVLQQVLNVLPKFVKPGDTLMAYEETSMLYYLTQTKPYMRTSWPMLYDPSRFTTILQEVSTTNPRLPVVVRAIASTASFGWPDATALRDDYRHKEDRGIMERFLQLHHYRVAWQNTFFQILVPQ